MFNQKLSKSHFGLFCLITAQLCISVNIVVNKYLITKASFLILLSLRFILSAIFLYGYLYYRQSNFSLRHTFNKLNKRDKVSIIIQGLLGGFLFNVLMLTGLKFTTATMTGVIASLLPALILILSFFILKEKIRSHEYISIGLATLGILFINFSKMNDGFGMGLHIVGDILIMLSLFPEAMYTIIAKLYPIDLCPIEQSTIVNIVNAIAFSVTLFFFPNDLIGILHISAFDWLLIIAVLTGAGALFFVLWNMGLSHTTTQQAGVVTAIVPAGACVLAVLFLHEHIHIYELIGISIIMMAIYIGAANPKLAFIKSLKKLRKTHSEQVEEQQATQN